MSLFCLKDLKLKTELCWSCYLQEWSGPRGKGECQNSGKTCHLSKTERMQRYCSEAPLWVYCNWKSKPFFLPEGACDGKGIIGVVAHVERMDHFVPTSEQCIGVCSLTARVSERPIREKPTSSHFLGAWTDSELLHQNEMLLLSLR